MKADIDLTEVEERLWEWAFYFRDRKRLERCHSIEHMFRPHSEDFAKEGWGDMEAAPSKTVKNFLLLRAIQTQEALMQLPKPQKWAITYRYCYPSLQRGLVLRMMKKWSGQRMNWKSYQEQLEIGLFRMHVWLKNV